MELSKVTERSARKERRDPQAFGFQLQVIEECAENVETPFSFDPPVNNPAR
jgi:hypothetical protein